MCLAISHSSWNVCNNTDSSKSRFKHSKHLVQGQTYRWLSNSIESRIVFCSSNGMEEVIVVDANEAGGNVARIYNPLMDDWR